MKEVGKVLDRSQPVLDVALGVGDDLAVFGRQHMVEFVHMVLDQFLEAEHDPRSTLGRAGREAAVTRDYLVIVPETAAASCAP